MKIKCESSIDAEPLTSKQPTSIQQWIWSSSTTMYAMTLLSTLRERYISFIRMKSTSTFLWWLVGTRNLTIGGFIMWGFHQIVFSRVEISRGIIYYLLYFLYSISYLNKVLTTSLFQVSYWAMSIISSTYFLERKYSHLIPFLVSKRWCHLLGKNGSNGGVLQGLQAPVS